MADRSERIGHLCLSGIATYLTFTLQRISATSRSVMLDVVMLVVGVGFFVAAILYALACDRM